MSKQIFQGCKPSKKNLPQLQDKLTSRTIKSKVLEQYSNIRARLEIILLIRSKSFIYLLHPPLGVHSIKRRHQPPKCTILSHVNSLIQGEVIGFQVLLDSLHPLRKSWWSPPVLQGGSCYDFWYSIWHLCNVAEQGETPCLDNSRKVWMPGFCLTSSFHKWWYHSHCAGTVQSQGKG